MANMTIDLGILAQAITTLGVIGGAALALIKFIKKHLTDRMNKAEAANGAIMAELQEIKGSQQKTNEELCIIVEGLGAALDGLKQQGCNGPVTEAKDKLIQHLNEQAHKQ